MTGHAAPNRIVRALRKLAFALVVVCGIALLVAAASLAALNHLSAYEDVSMRRLSSAIGAVALDEIGEAPRFAPRHPTGPLPVCADVPHQSAKALRLGLGLMRGTAEGRRLFDVLIEHEVCITVADLTYNGAYAQTIETFPGDWSASTIVVNRAIVRSSGADLLAAVLVHEAVHIDRAISGRDCARSVDCTRLPNGVLLEEEIAAHAAEAEWWITAFGGDGKRFAFRGDFGENELAKAYRRGDEAFAAYVRDYRDDPREGEGL